MEYIIAPIILITVLIVLAVAVAKIRRQYIQTKVPRRLQLSAFIALLFIAALIQMGSWYAMHSLLSLKYLQFHIQEYAILNREGPPDAPEKIQLSPEEESALVLPTFSIVEWKKDPTDQRIALDRNGMDEFKTKISTIVKTKYGIEDVTDENWHVVYDVLKDMNLLDQSYPTTAFDYSNAAAGFSMRIPYHPTWSNDEYVLPPYEHYAGDMIRFGPLAISDVGFSLYRSDYVWIQPQRTAEEALKAAMDNPLRNSNPPVLQESDSVTYVHYSTRVIGDSSAYDMYEIVGPTYNFIMGLAQRDRSYAHIIVESITFFDSNAQ